MHIYRSGSLSFKKAEDFRTFPTPSKKSKAIAAAMENKDFKQRTVHAMHNVISQLQQQDFKKPQTHIGKDSIKDLEKRLTKIQKLGLSTMKNILLPSVPRILQDLWVALEVIFAIFLFVLTCMQFDSEEKTTFSVTVMILACLDIMLATTDGFFYFLTSEFCGHYLKKMFKSLFTPDAGENTFHCCTCLQGSLISTLNQWFEIGRTLASELLLYPLILCDIIGFIYDKIHTRAQLGRTAGRQDFTLFVIANLYLLVSVHIMRLVLIIQTVKRLNSMPVKATGYKSEYVFLTTQFGITGVLQIITSIVIVLAVGVKIAHEEQYSTDGNVHVSPFLWVVIVTGWYLPVLGILCFFFVNYYWIHEFSMSYFIDLMSMLQGESFSEAVFGGESDSAEDKARELTSAIELAGTKSDIENYRRSPSNTFSRKLLYPLRNPLIVLLGCFYNASFLVFISCLLIHDWTPLIIEDSFYGIILFVLAIIALICNMQTMLVVFYWVLVVLGFVAVIATALMWKAAEFICCVPKCKRKKMDKFIDFYLSIYAG